jgi:hypothetical protein
MLAEHSVVPAELIRVPGRPAEHLRPPGDYVATVLGANRAAEQRCQQLVALDPVVESVEQALERPLSAGPLVQRRRLVRARGHRLESSEAILRLDRGTHQRRKR